MAAERDGGLNARIQLHSRAIIDPFECAGGETDVYTLTKAWPDLPFSISYFCLPLPSFRVEFPIGWSQCADYYIRK